MTSKGHTVAGWGSGPVGEDCLHGYPVGFPSCVALGADATTNRFVGGRLQYRTRNHTTRGCIILAACLYAMGGLQPIIINGQPLAFDVDVDFYRLPEPTTEVAYKFTMTVDARLKQWRLDYKDNPERFVCTYKDDILERPNYRGTKSWLVISGSLDGYPIDLDQEQRLMWFVYCGGQYLRTRTNAPIVLPFGDPRLDPYVHGCRIDSRWRSGEDACPELAVFSFDRDLFMQGVKQLSWESSQDYLDHRVKFIEQFLNGHTNGAVLALFKVLEWTNMGPAGIPLAWEFDLYWYGTPHYRCVGRTVTVRNVNTIQPPIIPTRVEITDKRVRLLGFPINSVNYTITNGQIPSVNDQLVMKRVQQSVLDARDFTQTMNLTKKRRSAVAAAALVCSGLLLPFLLWWVRKKLFLSRH